MLTHNPADVLHKLEAKLSDRSHADLGQFQLINLDVVRQGAGEQWDKLKAKIIDVSAHFIEKRISEEDVLLRYNEGFLVVFDALDAAEAEKRTEAISTELNTFFLGDEILSQLNIRSKAARLETEQLTAMMAGAASKAGDIAARGAAGERGSGAESANSSSDTVVGLTPAPRYEFAYRPIWDCAHSAVSANICVPFATERSTRRRLEGRQVLRGHDAPKEHLELDLAIAHRAMADFNDAFRDGCTVAVGLPVGAPSMITHSTRTQYFETLSAIPRELRRYFVLILEGVTDGTPASALQEITRTMRSFGPSTAVYLPLKSGGLDRLADCRVAMVAATLPDSGIDTGPNAPFSRFVTGARRQNCAVCIGNVRSEEDALSAMESGVRFLSGPAIADDLPAPAAPYVYTGEDLKRRNARRHLV